MKLPSILLITLLTSFTGIAQDKPTIYIDIPTNQKPWNHIEWNNDSEKFQFAIVTDRTGGHRPGVFPTGIKKLNLLQPEFVMSVGDLIEGYTKDTVRLNREWNEFKSFIEPLDAPFFYVPGNHDITNKVMEEKWKELFGVSYYHFVYKDVLFLCLNSEDNLRGSGRGTIDDKQYEYIKKTLEENEEVKWTLVFVHQPLWVQENTKRWKDVEQLLSNRNHNVFAGHYHRYWKTERNNGKYFALATTGGGSPLRGKAYGEFDHVVWATMTDEGPILANLFLDGIWDENVVTEELVELVRNRPFPVRIEPAYSSEEKPEKMEAEMRIINDSDVQMHVDLKGQSDNILFYQFENNSIIVEPNDVATQKIRLSNAGNQALDNFSTLNITADVTYKFENKPNVSFSSDLKFKPLFKNILNKTKVKIDGKLKEWGDATWHVAKDMEGAPFDFDGPDDCSLTFATAYDDENFYVAVKLIDNDFVVSEEGHYWEQDAIVLRLDARPSHLSAFNMGQGRGKDWISYLRTFKKNNPVVGEEYLPLKVKAATEMFNNGSQMEFAFPMEYIKKMGGENWSNLRFGIGYFDHDNDDENETTHFWFPTWNGSKDVPGSGMFFKE
ncbi:metallophosphoesterase [Croceivirga thetidis]|uniref:Calcineurin-like phosphoesterase domain-containing protein n=1 Tax=Croceivirga thetidis TaxID=2721623 RepID=A0ABX1GWN1_9FLAO|nr:metallophosphoesterase [Croceivirga thetidis]NKI33285.1 hypothetical protein [Croceivirga thetidis]